MKNIVVFAIGVVCTLFCHAQTENPRGIYKMTTLTGNLGEINAPFDQYKICTDSVTLHLHVHGDRFLIKDNDHQIFNYTGPNPKTPENKSILIYDSNEKQFMLKWWSNYETAYYPKNDWCLEKYESGVYSAMGRIIVDALTNTKAKDKEQPLLGTWRNLGYLDELKNTKKSIAQLVEQYPTSKYAHQYLVYNLHADNHHQVPNLLPRTSYQLLLLVHRSICSYTNIYLYINHIHSHSFDNVL